MRWTQTRKVSEKKITLKSKLIDKYKDQLTPSFLYSDKPLLTPPLQSHKTKESLNHNRLFYPAILYMINADLAGPNICPAHSKGCKASCLQESGRNQKGANPAIMLARLRRTILFHIDKNYFFELLIRDIRKLHADAQFFKSSLAIRLNGTSDIDYSSTQHKQKSIFEWFPDVTFYDYTKVANRFTKEIPNNYHLTFSASENNLRYCYKILDKGHNVAVVFNKTLPSDWLGYPVIDGDRHDLRFLDPKPCIVGLRAKAKAKSDLTGFTIQNVNTKGAMQC